MIETAIAYLLARGMSDDDEPEEERYCRECGRVVCTCLENGEDEEEVQA